MPNEKQLARLNSLLSAFDSGAVQPDELIKAIDAVMAVVKSSTETIANKVKENDDTAQSKLKELKSEIEEALNELALYSSKLDTDKVSKTDMERMSAGFKAEIERVISLIPEMPEGYDDSEMTEKMEEQMELIENLKSLVVAENLRNALEALPEGDKLAIEAIEGLRDELDKLKKNWGTGKGGGIGQGIVLDLIRESVANGTIPSVGSIAFTDLTDTPSSYTGQTGKYVRVNATEDGLEYGTPAGTGSGITRTIVVTSGNVTAGSTADTDYVYKISGAHVITLPTAVGNTNQYDIVNLHTASTTIATTSSQTIHGTAAPITIIPNQSLTLQSDGTNWIIK